MEKVETIPASGAPPIVRPSVVALRSRFSLGIAARLGVTFASVAILVATANIVFEHGITIIRTTRVERVAARPNMPVTVAAPTVAKTLTLVEPLPALKLVRSDALISAVSGFERAVAVRTERSDTETALQLRSSRKALEHEANVYLGDAHLKTAASTRMKLFAALKSYQARGERWPRLSRQ